MSQVALVVCCALAGMAAYHALGALMFVGLLLRRSRRRTDDSYLPRAAVLVSLRGADPHLDQGLRGLLSQDYPDYELRILVDRQEDPAWEIVQRVVRQTRATNVRVGTLRNFRRTCSLKCSAMVQMAKELDDSFEVVVTADGDLVPHASWLRSLVAPLADRRIAATYGNRWYMPQRGQWGSLVRYLWNAAAVVPMWFFRIPWGGTFAIRRSVLEESGLVDKWAQAAAEDGAACKVFHQQKLRMDFVPALMMVNREECDLAAGFRFIRRQLLWTRVYHASWLFVAGHALVTTGILLVAMALMLAGLAIGQTTMAAWTAGTVAGYLLATLAMLGLMEMAVRRAVGPQGIQTRWLSARMLPRLLLGIPLTQAVHLLAVFQASSRRRVRWRGVTYHVHSAWNVEMLHYRPYRRPVRRAGRNSSLPVGPPHVSRLRHQKK